MLYPYPSKILQRHRVEDERGLQFNWHRYTQLLGYMEAVTEANPREHAADPAQALQDAYADALHRAQAVLISEADLTTPGPGEWDGTPVWLEFDTPQSFGTQAAFEGALVFRLSIGKSYLLLPILLSKTIEWPQPALVSTQLKDLLKMAPSGGPLHAILTALTHLPPLPEVPPQHESGPTLTERLTRHLKRVKQLAPQALAALPRHYLRERESWDPRVFVPSSVVATDLMARDGYRPSEAVMNAPEVAVLGAWTYAKHVLRIDEDVLASLRRAKAPTRLPGALPGLTSHAVYVPVPGGLARRHQTGFFAALDDLDGQVRLLLLIESRSFGSTVLAPVSLPLGANIEEELRALADQPGANYSEAEVGEVHANLGLALLCIAYLGSPGTILTGPGKPTPAQPHKGKGGKVEFTEASGPRLWEAGLDVGERLRAYRVQAGRERGERGQSTGMGRPMPPHLRMPHPHGYWTGPGRSLYEVRFLDFIPVNMDAEDAPESPIRLIGEG